MTRRISARGIVLHQGKLLCVKLSKYAGTPDEFWCLPGGGLEEGESLLDCISREMLEETGIRPVVGALLYVQQFAAGDVDYMDFFFHITNSSDYLQIDLSKTTHGTAEIAQIEFIDPTAVRLLPEFLATEDLQAHAASGGTTKIVSRL